MVATTSIDGAGSAILVNSARLTPPYRIEAIGSQGLLDRFLAETVETRQPPAKQGHRLKLIYMTQIETRPPRFAIQVNNRGVGDNQIIVRGISSSGKPTVGLYFDEAVITGLGLDGGSDNQPNIQLHDMERIEILKGPQGTLFGAGSMSGTVRFIDARHRVRKLQEFSAIDYT